MANLTSAYKLKLSEGYMIMHTQIDNIFSDEMKTIITSKFNIYKGEGIIESDYSEMKWRIYDEKVSRILDFNIPELEFKRARPAYKREDLIYALKAFITIEMGSYSIDSIANTLSILKKVLKYTKYMTEPDLLGIKKKGKEEEERQLILRNAISFAECAKFFELNELEGMNAIASILNDDNNEIYYTKNNPYKQRDLAEFRSYFHFGKLFDRLWKELSVEERLHFYPAYIYYNLTMILPLRVGEFCVIPPNPIKKDYAGYHLTVRRTALKYGKKRVGYRLDTDYERYEYSITDDVARLFLEYEKLTENDIRAEGYFWTPIYQTENKHRDKLNKRNIFKKEYINYLFDELYDVFYEKYGIAVITLEQYHERRKRISTEYWNRNEIVYIRPGDTRHIASIGLVANGANVMILKEFMGHESVRSADHYYSNIKSYVDSYISIAYEKMPKEYHFLNTDSKKRELRYQVLKRKAERIGGGFCYADADVAECFKNRMQCDICKYYVADDIDTDGYRKKKEDALKKQADQVSALFRMEMSDGRLEEIAIAVHELQKMISERKKMLLTLAEINKEED